MNESSAFCLAQNKNGDSENLPLAHPVTLMYSSCKEACLPLEVADGHVVSGSPGERGLREGRGE